MTSTGYRPGFCWYQNAYLSLRLFAVRLILTISSRASASSHRREERGLEDEGPIPRGLNLRLCQGQARVRGAEPAGRVWRAAPVQRVRRGSRRGSRSW